MQFTVEQLEPWISVRYSRSAGPGGQNVNKLSTRCELSFDFAACPLISPLRRTKLASRYARRLDQQGRLRIVAQAGRTQSANRRTAEERLLTLLADAFFEEPPRIATRPTHGSQRRRVTDKRRTGEIKRLRSQRPGKEE